MTDSSATSLPHRDSDNIASLPIVAEPVSGSFQSERGLALQHAVTRALAHGGSFHDAIPDLLQAICILSGWEFGEIWLIDQSQEVMKSAGTWLAPKLVNAKIDSHGIRYTFQKGTSLPGRVWATGRALWLNAGFDDRSLPYTAGMARQGMKSVFASPILDRSEVAGVVVLFSLITRQPDNEFRDLMRTVGNQIGEFIRRRSAEEEIEKREQRFRALIENSSDVIALLSPEGKILYISASVLRVLGRNAASLVGKSAFEHIHPRDRVAARNMMTKLLRNPLESAVVVYRVAHSGGGWRWMEAVGTNMLANPAVHAIVANNRDITAYKEVEQAVTKLNLELELTVDQRTAELRSANEELEAFSYSVAHDLRAPLRALIGFTQVLMDEQSAELSGEGKRLLGIIQKSATRMGHLIDDLLVFSKFSRKELEPFARVNMRKMTIEIIEEVRHDHPEGDVEFIVSELPIIRCSGPMIRQVWINLISNALKFTRERPHRVIEIGSKSGKTEEIYFVKDNGVGFDMRHADKLFGIFQRLHSNALFEGTGVGLAIVKRIIDRHGGRVWANGVVGAGATIFFSIPKKGEGHHDRK